MPRSTTELLALHGLRLMGFAAATDVAQRFGLAERDVTADLERAAEAGFARRRTGERPGWALTAEGRKENERLLAVELDRAGHRTAVRTIYRDFLALNPRLLSACTSWQILDLDAQVLNDHQDPDYDASVIADLHEIHLDALPICADLESLLDRFGSYRPRLVTAMANIGNGRTEWFTKPTIDSYHTVWFELHEDLLATLGLDRAAEQN
ncbi:MAG: transcriptional regulator [Actinomycetota bacterium]